MKLTVRAHSQAMPTCLFLTTPTSLAFGLVTPPGFRDLSFQIKNRGVTDPCLITHLDLAPGADATFSLPNGEIDQRTLMPGEVLDVTVRATGMGAATTTLRQVVGAVRFGISSPMYPQNEVPLTAAIALACLTIAPSDLDFGTVKRGCNSSSRTFSLYNTCQQAVTINNWRMSVPAGQPAGGPDCISRSSLYASGEPLKALGHT